MPKVELNRVIGAPGRQVWNFISDIERAPEWVAVMEALVETTENPVQEGTVYREKSKIGPKESETEWRISRYDPPNIQVHECREPDFEATLTMRVEETGDGSSTLYHTTEYRLMPGFRPLGWLLENLFIKKAMLRSLNDSVDQCRRMIEEQNPPDDAFRQGS